MTETRIQRVLIYHPGSIGDTVIVFPFLRAVREHYPDATIDMFNFSSYQQQNCIADLLNGTGLVQRIQGISGNASRIMQFLQILRWWGGALFRRYQIAVYLDRTPYHQPHSRLRSGLARFVFLSLGISRIVGMKELHVFTEKDYRKPFAAVPSHVELLQRRFLADGFHADISRIDPFLREEERERARRELKRFAFKKNVIPLAIGIGGKKSACHWPLESYLEMIRLLQKRLPVFPVFFGGPEEQTQIDELISTLGSGASAFHSGATLSLRESIALLEHFALFIGNDGGSIHLAAAAGIPCLGIYGGRIPPGLWEPYTQKKSCIRNAPSDCEGCFCVECPKGTPAPCLLAISPEQVAAEAEKLLELSISSGI